MRPKILIWDTESTDLYATWGRLLCFTYMEPHERRAHILRISDYPLFKKDPTNDRELVKDIKRVLDEADMWFTWFGTKHDVPLVNSRLIYHELSPLEDVSHVDGWRVAKDKLRLPRNSLHTVSKFLGLEEKTPIEDDKWVRARAGHLPSLQYVYEHGLQDAVVTTMAYKRMLPLIPNHPNVHMIKDFSKGCPKCGQVGLMVGRGLGFSQKRAYQKFQCKACNGYTRGAYL